MFDKTQQDLEKDSKKRIKSTNNKIKTFDMIQELYIYKSLSPCVDKEDVCQVLLHPVSFFSH